MKYLAALFVAICAAFWIWSVCKPEKPVLPQGYEVMQMNDGFYLRVNGVANMTNRYSSKNEAIGRAYLLSAQQDGANHIKVDATLEASLSTNSVPDTNGVREQVHRQIFISFNVYQMPFRGLLRDDVVSDQIVPTNVFKLQSQR